MAQKNTSANTSINESQLPAVYGKVDFQKLFQAYGTEILDYGCGKFSNAEDYVNGIGGQWFGYDPYNRTEEQNQIAADFVLHDEFKAIICSNVLNVIDDENTVIEIAEAIVDNDSPYFVTIYEGNKSGTGRETKKDCYQRNLKTREYLRYFPGAVVRKGVITNHPELIK